ncbi:type I-F CRISPR-associated helicase Cas3f [Gallibacterium anatis]|uniref:type I-F CRISPR-associated helicase Cas3f n=1 Tax=Gallibacterium anatis TaxID=750 RepID=UPI000BA09B03|nr:type I-F CRISPR-associated helicase Cas3f [Gallibacterium anatis]WAX72100.1 type I-F CRISPR-associated helicase Cas3f [Gallibacterium anatis]
MKQIAWINGYTIQIISALAALLHDLGKSSIGFQEKLKPNSIFYADQYRHEWISVRLFEAMIQGCDTDEKWLNRLANWNEYQKNHPHWLQSLKKESQSPKVGGFRELPPLAQALIWLIASHHRVAFLAKVEKDRTELKKFWEKSVPDTLSRFYNLLSASKGWLFNENSKHPDPNQFWTFSHLASDSLLWQKAMQRWANKALQHLPLTEMLKSVDNISDPFILLLSRLSLITADHHYSSLTANPQLGDQNFPLWANTNAEGQRKQHLDEHLIGVCQSAVRFAHLLPKLRSSLPALKHKAFNKRNNIDRFQWQNRAFDVAKQLRPLTEQQGFFAVNMASTGCGKTIGNARIMYALSNPEVGARFTIALGLRVLTLQTGSALKEKLKLDDDQIAVLVGGEAVNRLFSLSQEKRGSESAEEWLDTMQIDGGFVTENAVENIAEFKTLLSSEKARNLLQTPLVTCTIDYLMNASECLRGGNHIVPILRLLSGDLILDEPDDFDQNDLPALSRLVHLAGLFGSRVLLSSATLTPDLISGLYEAYQSGRNIWNHNNQLAQNSVCCAWFDEFSQQTFSCSDVPTFREQHQKFVEKRIGKLKQQPVRRSANVLSLPDVKGGENQTLDWALLAEYLIKQAEDFHKTFFTEDNDSHKKVSIGLIRFSNIRPMIPTIMAMLQQQCAENTEIHICCYHSRQLLLLRNRLEQSLDKLLNRYDPQAIFNQPEIKIAVENSDIENHIFIVVGSPVTEVGRDHDYDWAIIDPSSMRSVIQLAGRVWRHRTEKMAETANIALLPSNWRGLANSAEKGEYHPIFYHPGFESNEDRLNSHLIVDLITTEQRQKIDAIARIGFVEHSESTIHQTLTELEHSVMAKMFHNKKTNYINGYWRTENAKLTSHCSLVAPFRHSKQPMEDFVCLPDKESDWHYAFAYSDKAYQDLFSCVKERHRFCYQPIKTTNPRIKPWLVSPLSTVLDELADALNNDKLEIVALHYATVSLPQKGQTETEWKFNEFLGFWCKKDEQ